MLEEANDAPVAEEVEIETVEEAEAETTEDIEATESEEEAVEPDDSSPSKSKVQSRIDELTKLRRETERDRDYWKTQAQNKQPSQQQDIPQLDPGKTLSDFDYDEAKYSQYVYDQARAEASQIAQQETQRQSAERRQYDFQSKEADFQSKHDDYMNITRNPELRISNEMVGIIQESEFGPQILYHLGKNESESARLSELSPLAMAREIGRLEVKVSTPVDKPKVSKTPPPTPKIKATTARTAKDPADMSDREFAKWRQSQIAKR